MKKFTGLVVILAALILGSYYVMGYFTEKKVKDNLQLINQSNGINVEIEEYNRGWFKSNATLNWQLHIPEHTIKTADNQVQTVAAEDYQLKMPLIIHHGPIIFANKTLKFGMGYAHTDLSLPPKLAEQFNNKFSSESSQPKLDLSMFISYLNNTSVDFSVPEFKLISKQTNGGQLEWLGMTSATTISSDKNKVGGNAALEGINFTKENLKVVLSSVTSDYNLHRAQGQMYLGDASISLPSLAVTLNNQNLLELKQINIHSDTNIEEGLFSSLFKSSLEKIVINNKTYGPGTVAIAIKNLDADALTKINDQANQIHQGTDEQRQAAVLAILPELPQLLSKGAEFEISELSFTMPEGTIEGNLILTLPKSEAANPFAMIQKTEGKGKLKVPAVVLKKILSRTIQQKNATPQQPQNIQQGIIQQMQQQNAQGTGAPTADKTALTPTSNPAADAQQADALADKQLAAMVQSGLILLQGNDYITEMSFNQGKLTVNGKPFEPAMLKFQ